LAVACHFKLPTKKALQPPQIPSLTDSGERVNINQDPLIPVIPGLKTSPKFDFILKVASLVEDLKPSAIREYCCRSANYLGGSKKTNVFECCRTCASKLTTLIWSITQLSDEWQAQLRSKSNENLFFTAIGLMHCLLSFAGQTWASPSQQQI